jgi:PadR family transcriptional regulator PadR
VASTEEADLLTLNRKKRIVLLILYRSRPMAPPRGEVLQGTLDLIVLKTLDAMGPLHGYGIAQRIQQVSEDLLKLNQGTLYPALLRLEQRGWIGSKWGVSDNNRKAKYYSLTRAGRKQLASEAESWERMVAVMGRLLAGTQGA